MIAYREQGNLVSTRRFLDEIPTLEIRDLLIAFGQFECGIADANGRDIAELRRIAVLLGRVFYRSSKGLPASDLALQSELSTLAGLQLPEKIEIREPEGYAFYGLFPESYIPAAEEFFAEVHPREAVCIGIRSIGTSLSAVVAGTLAEMGARVETCTVRPHGHPFDRVSDLPPMTARDVPHLIVDEGPGLSGSSFASVAEALSNAGVPDSQIIFFPNWRPEAAALISEKARDRWARHRAFAGSFDPEAIRPGMRNWQDVSAGAWRGVVFSSECEYPAVHPQHERRKFLSTNEPRVLAKFSGFGSRGRTCLERARSLHDAGFVPRPIEFANGFLFSSFVPGQPVSRMSRELLDRIAQYLAHISRRATRRNSGDELIRMMTRNISEALNVEWTPSREMLAARNDDACVLDNRMQRHEWIETASGFLKTDAVDHADDHFFPGPQNIAWDVAGAAIEFSLDDPSSLLDRYARLSGDREIDRRLPFYALAYSAFRLGYCRMAQMTVDAAERDRFAKLEQRYIIWINRYSGVPQEQNAI
jgi:hypothetical protein